MLLGIHPIPARSPAEREGQSGKEGVRQRRWRGGGLGGWGSADVMIGEKRQRIRGESGRQGVEGDSFSRGRQERKWGVICYMNERECLIRARENNQQLTTSGHINIGLLQLKAYKHDEGRKNNHSRGWITSGGKVHLNNVLSKDRQLEVSESRYHGAGWKTPQWTGWVNMNNNWPTTTQICLTYRLNLE